MNKNLLTKAIFILILVVMAGLTLYPPQETLKPGIDLAGGTSLIYEINTQGLTQDEQRDLSQRMITVLRRRIDPANIQNMVWRPQGNTRFEIQMPLATKDVQEKRKTYGQALNAVLEKNVSPVTILQSLRKPVEARTQDFETFAKGDPNRMAILEELAAVHDERKAMQQQRDTTAAQLEQMQQSLSEGGANLNTLLNRRSDWADLLDDPNALTQALEPYNLDPNELRPYLETYQQWSQAVTALTDTASGLNTQFKEAVRALDRLNLTEEQLKAVLELTRDREDAITALKEEFPDRAELIDQAAVAYDEYRPYRGRLDDPQDLQRMLTGAGILEFRILPQSTGSALTQEEAQFYIESLSSKGPTYASTNEYMWCEIEDQSPSSVRNWAANIGAIVGQFGQKYYVLASNQAGECLLHSTEENTWKLERAYSTSDQVGRRAIGFSLNDAGTVKFAELTGNNIDRPLCILLDGIAISAPSINDRIYGSGIITGSFSETEIMDMVNKLNAGSLPARLIEQPISVHSIGPSIGASNRDQGIKAGIIGLVVVMICMLLYYLKAGAIADMALIMNILFVLAIMAGVDATFTLPGIAGIILTIGMSVDANVLIFERIREEQDKGSSLSVAVKNGYSRAFRTIFDANLTTFITAAILYWVASEDIKGFAIVLMLGILSSMFTALFVTRVVFDWLIDKRLVKDRLVMLRLIHQPKIDWMKTRPIFFVVSGLLILSGLFVFFSRDYHKYDIEFTGGTSVQVTFKEPMSRDEVEQRIQTAGQQAGSPALASANVTTLGETGRDFEITTTETNKTTATVTLAGGDLTADTVARTIRAAQGEFRGRLSNLRVTPADQPNVFEIATSQVNQELVANVLTAAFPEAQISDPQVEEIVNNTIRTAFEGALEIQTSLEPDIVSAEKITDSLAADNPVLANSVGGIKITCSLGNATTPADLDQRLKSLRFKPDLRDLEWYPYPYRVLDTDLSGLPDDRAVTEFIYISLPPDAGLRELSDDEWERFETNETRKITAAAGLETSLPRVTQIDPSVGTEQKQRALIAILLSLSAIVGYIWIRFGDLRYGLAAIIALVHDVCIILGVVTASFYLANSAVGQALLVADFKINLAMIAAFLTLIGYSLNDTIVVFDRIRENRLKAQLNPQTINNSINQTISRTVLTSFTTFIVVLIMYIFGGDGLRGFTFAIGLGVLIGTYSSIAIASPVLLIGRKLAQNGKQRT